VREDAYNKFDKLDSTHWFPCGRRHILQALITQYAGSPREVADIGCGPGTNVEMLRKFGDVIGVDNSLRAIQYCRRKNIPKSLVSSLPSLPFADGKFDLVCAIDVIEHIDDDAAAVRELLRVCSNEGWLLITVPAYRWLWSAHDEVNQHKRRYSRREVKNLMADMPVEIVKLTHFNLFLSLPIIVVRFWDKLKRLMNSSREPNLDYKETPRFLNWVLLKVLASEQHLIRGANLPAGISIACLARKRPPLDS